MARPASDHLEAVVVLRVVAAGHLDAAVAAVLGARRRDVVQHRRRHGADVDDVEAGRGEAAHQRGRQRRARASAVAADGDRALAGRERLAAEGAAEVLGEARVDRLADDAADVVGLEDGSGDLHEKLDLRGGGDCRDRPLTPPAAGGRATSSPPRSGRYPGGNQNEILVRAFHLLLLVLLALALGRVQEGRAGRRRKACAAGGQAEEGGRPAPKRERGEYTDMPTPRHADLLVFDREGDRGRGDARRPARRTAHLRDARRSSTSCRAAPRPST